VDAFIFLDCPHVARDAISPTAAQTQPQVKNRQNSAWFRIKSTPSHPHVGSILFVLQTEYRMTYDSHFYVAYIACSNTILNASAQTVQQRISRIAQELFILTSLETRKTSANELPHSPPALFMHMHRCRGDDKHRKDFQLSDIFYIHVSTRNSHGRQVDGENSPGALRAA
jgi:hypothetical protein